MISLRYLSEAKEYLLKAIQINSNDFEFLLNLGYMYLNEDNYNEALIWFNKAKQIKSNHPKLISYLKQVQNNLNKQDK